MGEVLIVLTDMLDLVVAESLARYLIERKLAAGVNCLPGVKLIQLTPSG
jgi:uncharacterized protein involved in tolerance to divalent cations